MTTLVKRLSSSAVFIAITLLTIFAVPQWLFFAVVEGFALAAMNEYLKLLEKKGVSVHRPFVLAMSVLLPAAVTFNLEGLILVLMCLGLFLFHFKPETQKDALPHVSLILFGMIYVVWFLSHLIMMRGLDQGAFWVFYVILLAKGGDAAAYFAGTHYGKTKLIMHISPNKTVEGAWAGLLAAVALSLLSKFYFPSVPWKHLWILGVSVGILAQLADLVESLIKRDAGVKDSGEVPGLGGVLDVLDSLLLTIPFVYYYITLFLGV